MNKNNVMDTSNSFIRIHLEHAISQFKRFTSGRESHLSCVIKFRAPREMIVTVYRMAINEGILTKIEDLPEQKKKELRKEILSLATGLNATHNQLMDACRCLHLFNLFAEPENEYLCDF